ncbi:NAD dependent epimerase/dehydratase family protein-like protein [Chaetomium sp. MPI-CAGE-AT-0009]|nr:NAD dependent epimerase/dehydratase family protein-like protein [Chaetomium sp. MPI-CAGE-AT-0009]
MASKTKKVLLTGATGYIGGSVLTALLNATEPVLQSAPITCLVRGADRAALLSSTYGARVKPILYQDLDDVETATAVAAEHDIVIHTTVGFHPASALALVRGLARRRASTGRDVWMIHTSGTSNVHDDVVSQPELPIREWDDVADDIYAVEKEREAAEPYAQRTTELGVIDAGLELGVKTVVLMSPLIYGAGTGLFNKIGMWTDIIKPILQRGQAAVAGDGAGVWNHVHVEDLADLYKLVLLEILERQGRALPTGKKGIMFSGSGRHSWLELTHDIAGAGYEEGLLPDRTVARLTLEEAARGLGPAMAGGYFWAYTGARTVASVAARLGWTPSMGEHAWKRAIRHDVKAVADVLVWYLK